MVVMNYGSNGPYWLFDKITQNPDIMLRGLVLPSGISGPMSAWAYGPLAENPLFLQIILYDGTFVGPPMG